MGALYPLYTVPLVTLFPRYTVAPCNTVALVPLLPWPGQASAPGYTLRAPVVNSRLRPGTGGRMCSVGVELS